MSYHSIVCLLGCDGWPCDCWCHQDPEEEAEDGS